MKTPNYHDFYQKSLIPIGVNDKLELEKWNANDHVSPSTHWLIAVEGEQLPQPRIYFHWKVTIYPADSEGDFNWKTPFYSSQKMASMDKAIQLAGAMVQSCRNDELAITTIQEKIS